MEFGYGFVTAQRSPSSQQSYTDVYEDAIRLVRVAKESGYDAIWVSEHHGFEDGYSPSVLPSLPHSPGKLRRLTSELESHSPPYTSPSDWPKTPRRLISCRVAIFVSGSRTATSNTNSRRSMSRLWTVPRVEDAVAVCRRGWSGDRFDYDGYRTDFDAVRVQPTPAQEGGPPILLGGVSEPAVRRAGRLADGYLGIVYHGDAWAGPFTVRQFRQNVAYIRDERGELGNFTLAIIQYANVTGTDDEAWESLLPHLAYLEGQ